ncbi:MAG: glycosyltransferase, partial [Bdellovibrionaceae bacterium]|nr:glycosyltransferase [Pseudobdellovibrionaceae bacterium]
MKVIQLLSQIELTGAEVHAIQLAELLSKESIEGLIISDQIHRQTSIPIRYLKIHNANFFTRWVSIFKLRKIIRTEKIDIVHAHSRAAVRVGFWATRLSPCALVSTLHGKQHYSL